MELLGREPDCCGGVGLKGFLSSFLEDKETGAEECEPEEVDFP